MDRATESRCGCCGHTLQFHEHGQCERYFMQRFYDDGERCVCEGFVPIDESTKHPIIATTRKTAERMRLESEATEII